MATTIFPLHLSQHLQNLQFLKGPRSAWKIYLHQQIEDAFWSCRNVIFMSHISLHETSLSKAFFLSDTFFCSQTEMISEPDPEDEGTKISVSWKMASRSHLLSFPAEHNSSWFSWIRHVRWEKGDNQQNQWQCVISVKVVPFLLQKGCSPFYPLSAALRVIPSLRASPLLAVWSKRNALSWKEIGISEVIYYFKHYYQIEIQSRQ